jgi:hypothetical protein
MYTPVDSQQCNAKTACSLDVVPPSRKVADTGAWIILGACRQVAQQLKERQET